MFLFIWSSIRRSFTTSYTVPPPLKTFLLNQQDPVPHAEEVFLAPTRQKGVLRQHGSGSAPGHVVVSPGGRRR